MMVRRARAVCVHLRGAIHAATCRGRTATATVTRRLASPAGVLRHSSSSSSGGGVPASTGVREAQYPSYSPSELTMEVPTFRMQYDEVCKVKLLAGSDKLAMRRSCM
jgi:hypothetical protein